MRERDLERATQLFAQIQSLHGDLGTHDNFGKHLHLLLEMPRTNIVDGGPEVDWMDAAKAYDLNPDELHMRTNFLIRAMLDEKMTNIKAELRKLGVKLDDDAPPVPKAKAPKQKLLPAPNGGNK